MVDCRIGGVEQERMSIACGKNYIGHRWKEDARSQYIREKTGGTKWSFDNAVCARCETYKPKRSYSILNGKPIPKELVVEGYPELEWEFGWHVKTIIDDNC